MLKKFLFFTALSVLLMGCAHMQKDDDLASATAFTLGVDKVQIISRHDDGMYVDYTVKTPDGKNFNCTRGVGASLFGVNKSSPLCNPVGKQSSAGSGGNALLKAAGK